MPNTTDNFADPTDRSDLIRILDDALGSLKVSGSVLLREAYVPPWSIAIPDRTKLAELLASGPGTRVVAFHLVELGHCAIQPEGSGEILLTAGDMAICFGGAAHRLTQGQPTEVMDVESLLARGHNPRSPKIVGQSAGASLLCGAFVLHDTALNPLFAALPSVLHASLSRPGELHNLSGVARLMAEELDKHALSGGYVVGRLLEVLCAEAVRAHMESVPRHESNWFRGVKDTVVGRALAAFHARPGDPWSVAQLAAVVSMSPSRFSARFTDAVGDSPMVYVTKWRMNIACRLLKGSRRTIDRIATEIGYDSQAAFSRVFKKHLGVSPAAWRGIKRAQNIF
jgi:AraC-like DNA-binding protein